jgi:hypothetical protein
MGRYTYWALCFALFAGSWLTFKEFESRFFPVVTDFRITEVVEQVDSTVDIYGSFSKVRDCEFVGVVAYSGPTLVRVSFVDGEGRLYPDVTRLARKQFFGPWRLEPKTAQLELYVTHNCSTGIVVTELFEGALVL